MNIYVIFEVEFKNRSTIFIILITMLPKYREIFYIIIYNQMFHRFGLFLKMSLNEEVVNALCMYVGLCIVFSLIYIFMSCDKLSVDFILSLNYTGNLSFSLWERGELIVSMEEIYWDATQIVSFRGVDALHRAAQGKITKKKTWLEGVHVYRLHKSVRRKFKTNRVIVYSID